MKHKITTLFILASSLFVTAGCSNSGNGGNNYDPDTTYVFDDEHLSKESIHIGINDFKRSGNVVVENSISSYKIIADKSNTNIGKAANTFAKRVSEATGALLTILDIDEVKSISSADKYFVFDASGKCESIPSVDLISSYGYGIKTIGNSIYLSAYHENGISNGVHRLLNCLVGYEALLGDCVYYEIDGEEVNSSTVIYLPILDIIEKPDYRYRIAGQTLTPEDKNILNIVNLRDVYITIGDGSFHNSLQILPPQTYKASHPSWYSYSPIPEFNEEQICYTAHGNEEELNLMIEEISKTIVNQYLLDTSKKVAIFGQMDLETQCSCESCRAVYDRYQDPSISKKAYSANIINFINKLDDYLKANTVANDVSLQFFAYQESMNAPYDPNHELHLNPTCGVLIAPSRASYTHSFYDPMQKDMEKDYPQICRDWAQFSDNIYIWYYQTQFKTVLYPFQTFSTTIDNCRFGFELGGQMVYPEGDEFNSNHPAFGNFKDYLYAKGSFNVNVSYSELKQNWFNHYYGPAGGLMNEFYDQLMAYLTYLSTKEVDCYKGLITNPGYDNVTWWNKRMLVQWKDMVLNALNLLDENKKMYLDKYDTYVKHVKVEGIFPYLALCTLFANEFADGELLAMRQQFASWCRELGINYYSEYDCHEKKDLEAKYFTNWGV